MAKGVENKRADSKSMKRLCTLAVVLILMITAVSAAASTGQSQQAGSNETGQGSGQAQQQRQNEMGQGTGQGQQEQTRLQQLAQNEKKVKGLFGRLWK
jgi:opacity protein-like surface antigen